MATNSKKASVLMPCYNSESYLREAIVSILNQSFGDFEFLIINDGSTDRCQQILNEYNDSRIRVIENGINIGLISSLNRGLSVCEGEYIIRMDSDDISEPERFKRLIEYMDNHPEIGACSSYFEFGINSNNIIRYPLDHDEIYINFLTTCPFGHAPAILRRSVLAESNLKYDPAFIHSEDSNLWVRMLNLTRFANYPEMLYRVRLHEASVTQKYHEQVDRSFKKSRDIHFANICKKLNEEVTILPFENLIPDYNHIKLLENKCLSLILKNEQFHIFNKILFRKNLVLLWIEIINGAKVISFSNMVCLINSPLLRYQGTTIYDRLKLIKKWMKRHSALSKYKVEAH